MAYKQKTQIFIRMENFGLGYWNSIDIDNQDKWQDRLVEYLEERERYEKWVALFGSDKYMTVVFHSDYFSGRNLGVMANHLMVLATRMQTSGLNPFISKNWEYGSRELPGNCEYNNPMTGIHFLHGYITSFFTSPLAKYCVSTVPFFSLVNKEIHDDMNIPVTFERCDELDNNDGVLLVSFTTPGYCFMATDTYDNSNAKYQLPKYVPIDVRSYMLAFHPEHETTMTIEEFKRNEFNTKNNKPVVRAMRSFRLISTLEIICWFPGMKESMKTGVANQDTITIKGLDIPLELEDAQAMHVLYPDTFMIPSQESLDMIAAGSIVKICAKVPKPILSQLQEQSSKLAPGSERFWVDVISTDGKKITGSIRSDVQFIGKIQEDVISFEQCNVYQIL